LRASAQAMAGVLEREPAVRLRAFHHAANPVRHNQRASNRIGAG